jgi:adenine-specific DNA-methyltransferase
LKHQYGIFEDMKIGSHFDFDNSIPLYTGDCLDFLKEIPDKSVTLVVTSPPYNIGKEYEKKTSIVTYLSWQEKVINECYRVLRDEGSICWEVGNYVNNGEILPLDIMLFSIFNKLGLHLRNRIIWHFGHGLHCSNRFSGRYETILWFTKSDDYIFNLDSIRVPQKYPNKKYYKGEKKGEFSSNPLGKNPSDVWEIPNVKSNHVEKTIHPCQFPVELIERLVLSLTNEGDLVVDPFSGVGSTAIASLIHNRKAAGAEIVEEYVTIAKQRILDAENGKLRIRPMERPVYDPQESNAYVPPKTINLHKPEPLELFEKISRYDNLDN